MAERHLGHGGWGGRYRSPMPRNDDPVRTTGGGPTSHQHQHVAFAGTSQVGADPLSSPSPFSRQRRPSVARHTTIGGARSRQPTIPPPYPVSRSRSSVQSESVGPYFLFTPLSFRIPRHLKFLNCFSFSVFFFLILLQISLSR